MSVYMLQDQAVNSDHQWVETNASGDYCYAMDLDCKVSFVCQSACLRASLSAILPALSFVCFLWGVLLPRKVDAEVKLGRLRLLLILDWSIVSCYQISSPSTRI